MCTKPLMPGIRRALRRLARSERGFAVPTVVMITVAGLSLAGATVIASTYAQRGSVRDQDSKNALAAADAGIATALYRQNKISTTQGQPCVVTGIGAQLVPGSATADGWCPPQSGTVGGRGYTYRVKPWTLVSSPSAGAKRQLEVVSQGDSDSIRRRVEVVASARDGSGVFGNASAVGVDGVTIGSSSQIGTPSQTTNAATNGDVITENTGFLCGDASHGVGEVFSGTQCSGYSVFESPLSLPAVDPGIAWTDNSNFRFFSLDPKSGNMSWDAATRTMTMSGGSTVTLGSSEKPYSFCRLEMHSNSQLIVAQGAVVTIVFHSPETCGLSGNPVEQIMQTGNNRLLTTSGNPSDLRIVMEGSTSIPTLAHLTGNSGAQSGSNFTMYAPLTDVELWGSTQYNGAVAGKTLTVGGSALFTGDDRANNAQLPISIVYHRDRYVECTGGTIASPPDASC